MFRPYFEQQSVDYAIIDVAWNGILESVKIAAMADAYEVNVAPHNFNGHLGSLISAHFCAAVPNFKVMEIDIDDIRWKDEIVTVPPVIENGASRLADRPRAGAPTSTRNSSAPIRREHAISNHPCEASADAAISQNAVHIDRL